MVRKFFGLTSLQSLFRRSQFMIFAITFIICTFTFASISVFTVQSYANQNLALVGRTVSERIQPALVFKDKVTLSNILYEYSQQHSVRLIEVFNEQGQKVSESHKQTTHYSLLQDLFDDLFFAQPIKLDVFHNGSQIGEVFLYGSSQDIILFVIKISLGLLIGMLFMLFALWWSVNITYRHIMKSITPIMHTAELVGQQKAYNIRFPKNDIKEFNDLNTVFNQLLEEIQTWHQRLQSENLQLNHQVQHDELTQLPNRNYFYQALHDIFENPVVRDQTALIFIDNNNFKGINDKYGHLVGDEVLKEMAHRLRNNIRQNDFVARLSGDEFAIILNSVHQIEHLISIAENLIKCSKDPLIYKDQTIYFSFSLGIAIAREALNPEDLIAQADRAMYKAKNLKHHWFIYHH